MRYSNTERRESTKIRDDSVHGVYKELANELGTLVNYVSKSYIYDKISERTGLCRKTIAFILNHTKKQE